MGAPYSSILCAVNTFLRLRPTAARGFDYYTTILTRREFAVHALKTNN
jgi:hypothetical protein